MRAPPKSSTAGSKYPGPATALMSEPLSVVGLFMRSDVEVHGRVVFGNEVTNVAPHISVDTLQGHASTPANVLNVVQHCIVHTQLDNLHSIPTDCPQREKRGWMGDAQWTSEEASLNMDMQSLCVSLSEVERK